MTRVRSDMKKLVVVVLLLGVGGYVAWAKVLRAPRRACSHLKTICTNDDANDCTDFFDAMKENAGSDEANKTAQCVLDSTTCPEAMGCMAGGGIKLGAGAARSFLDGLQRAVH